MDIPEFDSAIDQRTGQQYPPRVFPLLNLPQRRKNWDSRGAW